MLQVFHERCSRQSEPDSQISGLRVHFDKVHHINQHKSLISFTLIYETTHAKKQKKKQE